jgi:two-component system response regulator NreC
MSQLRIVLSDDHAVVRSGLRLLLEAQPGWDVVAESGDADSAADQVRAKHPDVLVLDLSMPGRPSLDVIPELRRDAPSTGVLILTMEADPAMARAALVAGAAAYVLKEATDEQLVHAIDCVAGGGTYLDPTLGAALAGGPPASDLNREGLSARELEVLRLVALGNTNQEIARHLGLSVRTIESHRCHILAKTDRTTRAELVAYAIDAGLLDTYRARRPRLARR